MLTRWRAVVAAGAVTVLTLVLVALDVTDSSVRLWWAKHTFTTDTLAGVVVVLVTVLVVDQVVRRRQVEDRSRAMAAQAAIVLGQAEHAARAASAALADPGGTQAAAEEVRTYMAMLLVAAPVLIDADVPRAFLEQAQSLGARLARTVLPGAALPGAASGAEAVEASLVQLREISVPLLKVLNNAQRAATGADDPGVSPITARMAKPPDA